MTALPRLRRAAWWLLLATLALLPFESWLPQLPLGRLTVTTLEAVWGLAIALWLLILVLERRRPRVPRGVLAALGALLVVNLASAALATGDNADAFIFVGRSAAGWLLFMAVADSVSDVRRLRAAIGSIVAAAALSAVLGVLLLVVSGLTPALGFKTFYAAGAARLTATFDYPNIAAMAFEAAALLGLGLIALDWRLRRRWLEIAAVALITFAMMLTLSRGAALGAAVGLLSIAVVALFAQRRRLAGAIAACAVFVVVATLLVQVAVAPIQRLFTDAEQGLYGATYVAPAAAPLSNGTASITVAVTNTGTLSWNVPGGDRFALGYHWLSPGTTAIIADGSASFALGSVAPGQTQTVSATISAPDSSATYDIAWDVVRNGYSWFSERGVSSATTHVGAQVAAAPPPTGTAGLVQLNADEVGPSRAQLWTAAAKMILDRPVLGVGPGTYRLRYAGYIGLGPDAVETHSNNLYLQLAAETGVLGLLAFLCVVALALAPLVRRLLAPAPTRTWIVGAALVAAVAAFLGHGFVDYFFSFNPTNGLWWATLGLVLAARTE